jgi:adenylate cyclase
MTLAATLDPESLSEIMHGLFNESAAVVQRYQGTVDKFTGDGLMALFGAPIALEDHALRAAISALEIQAVACMLADDVRRRHNMELQVRVGLNSGEVITGDIGIGPASFTAVGHPVGMAQRMEAAANPGAVLCSETTARQIERAAGFGPVEWVAVKGSAEPVAARRLERVDPDRIVMGRDEGPLMGREAELAGLLGAFDTAPTKVVGVLGEPGVGKSRLIREFVNRAAAAGAEVVTTRCDSHTANIPLHALSRLLHAMFGTRGLAAPTARTHVTTQLTDAEIDPSESWILFDLLSLRDPTTAPTMSADARRRRLIEVMGKIARTRAVRRVFVVEDVHWIDPTSEEVIAEFASTLASTPSMLVSSFRPSYRGRLREQSDPVFALAPLDDSTTLALVGEIVGNHPSVRGVAERVMEPSAGNPFFVEEIVRDLVGRGYLQGNRGDYRLVGRLNSIAVPTTVQSVLAARIDRLGIADKSVLNAAAVIGSTFDLEGLRALVPDTASDQLRNLVSAELIDQIQLLPQERYAFRHPLVRAVSYESQLTTTRADGHRRLAAAIEARNPRTAEENSALIAHHLEAAGELHDAYASFMRSAEWLKDRDVMGARECWERARAIADSLPPDQEDVISKRIAPRALLTFTGWQTGSAAGSDRWFDELRELATESGDLLSLAMGMSGRLDSLALTYRRIDEASVMASELLELVDQVDATASQKAEMLLSVAGTRYVAGEFENALRITERLLRMGPEATIGDLVPAMCMAGVIKTVTGRRADGRRDLAQGIGLAQQDHPVTFAAAVAWKTDLVVMGFELADEALVDQTRNALRAAESVGDAYALSLARWAHGTALLRTSTGHREVGLELVRESCDGGINSVSTWCDAEISMELVRQGRLDEAIDSLSTGVLSDLHGHDTFFVGYPTAVLVRLLMERHAAGDRERARELVVELEVQQGSVVPAMGLWPLHCRAVFARAAGDHAGYAKALTLYRQLAERLEADGHVLLAQHLAAESSISG